jgi:hypothetical protein
LICALIQHGKRLSAGQFAVLKYAECPDSGSECLRENRRFSQ